MIPELKILNRGFFLNEGETPQEYRHGDNFAKLSGKFDSSQKYGAWRQLTGDEIEDRYLMADLLAGMCGYIPPEYMNKVKLIYHPLGACGTGEIEYKTTFGWKYTP